MVGALVLLLVYKRYKPMKKITYALILSIFMFLCSTQTVHAKPRLDVLQKGGFVELSTEDMKDTVNALVEKIAKEQDLPYVPTVSCYDWEGSNNLAYNTLITKTICVNLAHFRNDVDATAVGVTVEYHLVRAVAHEVRHSYQWEHQFDDSDYGRACLNNFNNRVSYNGYNLAEYNAQFTEADADAYAIEYADSYFKRSKK